MNWLDQTGRGWDRLLSVVAPRAAARNSAARIALDVARAYEAAQIGRRTEGWLAGSGSANAEIAPSLVRVRNRCRQMVRDNEYAFRGLEALVAHTVGTGIIAKAPDQGLWDRWMQYCDADGQLDFNGVIELAHRTRRESGEVLIRFRVRDPDAGFEVPLQLQLLEPDHLDDAKTGQLDNGNFAICGVEFSPYGQRLAYWLYPVHPGEIASWRRNTFRSVRVPASEVLHYYRKRRPTQVRGIPEFACSLLRLRDFADYQYAQLMLKKMQSCFVAFVRSDDEQATLGVPDGSKKPRQEKLQPGMIKYLKGADTVTFGSPPQGGDDLTYTTTQLQAVAAGGGGTYEMMTGDYSKLSFSGGRLSNLALRPLIEQEQWLALLPMLLNPIANRFQRTAILAGKQKGIPQVYSWTMPRMQLGDLLKEAMGIKELIRGGLISLPEGIRELGYDPDQVLRENKDYRKALAEAGVLVDSDPAVSLKLIDQAAAAKVFEVLLKD